MSSIAAYGGVDGNSAPPAVNNTQQKSTSSTTSNPNKRGGQRSDQWLTAGRGGGITGVNLAYHSDVGGALAEDNRPTAATRSMTAERMERSSTR